MKNSSIFVILIGICICFIALKFVIFNQKEEGFIGHFHMQTVCSDGFDTYEDYIREALKLKLNFITLADHRLCKEYAIKCKEEKRILCVVSEMISTPKGYIIAFDINQPIIKEHYYEGSVNESIRTGDINLIVNISLKEAVERIHTAGGIAIADRNIFLRNKIEDLKGIKFDAILCAPGPNSTNTVEYYERLAKELGVPCVYSQIVHRASQMEFLLSSCNATDLFTLKTAIKESKCKPYVPFFAKIKKFLTQEVL